ncbi:MAG: hypothetical protein IT371_01250 [Deltaproteobacteria bacterium]|nr:hypothetical protein [Deltaproteobacteria bacterium]
MRNRPTLALRLLPALLLGALLVAAPTPARAQKAAALFARAKEAFDSRQYARAARLCWRYIATNKEAAEKYESAQFFLAASLEKLGFYHGAVEYYFQVANNRRTPELLPRAIRALEALSLSRPIDESLILRDLVGDTDFGDLPDDLADFVNYWQGVSNLHRGLDDWAGERFNKIGRQGYYYFAALYVASVRLLHPSDDQRKEAAVTSFARLFGPLDLGSALEAVRRRGEGDSKLGYALKSLINDDNMLAVQYGKLPKGWEDELTMLGLARVAAETGALLDRAKESDEESLGRPFAYNVEIGGMPVYRRAPRFEARAGAIRAVAARLLPVRQIRGQALHALARLLYEHKRFGAAYETLGQIPKNTELSSEILLERAWAKYKAGDPHRAMGLLYALDAPVYKALFAPEKYVLRGLIYRRFCHFRAAKIAARRFRIHYANTLRDIRQGDEVRDIGRVRAAALRRVQSRKLHLFARALREEIRKLDRQEEEWGKIGLLKNLHTLYRRKDEQARAELDRSLDVSAREVAEEMLNAEEQVNLLEYEVGQAIFQRVADTTGVARGQKKAAKVPVSSERIYYRFGGEYWTDELPNYKFNIEDRCVE